MPTCRESQGGVRKEENDCVLMTSFLLVNPRGEITRKQDNRLVLLGTSFTMSCIELGQLRLARGLKGVVSAGKCLMGTSR